jgi:hypothetical protein
MAPNGMDHVRNGLFFQRHEDGSVHILKKDGFDGPDVFEAVLDSETWVALVARLSRHGATAEVLGLVSELHLKAWT